MKIRTMWPALAVTLAGCVHIPTAEDGLSYEQRRTQLEKLESWHMSGRIAVDTGKRAYQGRFQLDNGAFDRQRMLARPGVHICSRMVREGSAPPKPC